MSVESLTITYDGDALREARMDVRDLGPALLALGELLQAANRTVNGERIKASVRVGPQVLVGSFPISFEVLLSWADSARQILGVTTIKDAVELIGSVFGSGGLLYLIRQTNGKRAKGRQLDGKVEVTTDEGAVIVDAEVFALHEDSRVRDALARVARPLRQEGIDEIRVQLGKDRPAAAPITKRDLQVIQPPAGDLAGADVVTDSEYEMVLKVVRPHFERGHRWGLQAGKQTYGAEIHDDGFMDRVQRRELRFGKDDAIRVRMRTRVAREPSGEIKAHHTIEEVLDVLPAATPRQLLLGEPPLGEPPDESSDKDPPR